MITAEDFHLILLAGLRRGSAPSTFVVSALAAIVFVTALVFVSASLFVVSVLSVMVSVSLLICPILTAPALVPRRFRYLDRKIALEV